MPVISWTPRVRPLCARRAVLAAAMIAAGGTNRQAHADTKQACGDAYYAVQVLRDEGRLEEALEAARVCVSDSCAQFVQADCAAWRSQIESTLAARPATVVVEAFDEEGSPIQEATATLEGAPWLTRLDGQARELPAGPHVIEVTVVGEEPQRRSILLRPGEKDLRVVFTFDTGSELGRGDGPFPWVLGGVGLAALIGGAVTGGLVIDAYLTTQDECNDATRTCSVAGLAAQDEGRTLGPVTTALLVGGGVLLTVGLVWRFAAPSNQQPATATLLIAPTVGPNEVGLTLHYTD